MRRICAVVPGWVEGFGALAKRHASDRLDFVSLAEECDMSESLKTGWRHMIEECKPDALMISLADKPLVTSDIVDLVIDRFARSECRICVAAFEGKWGHPVILNADLGQEVYDLKGDQGARDLIEAHRESVLEVPVSSDAVLVDVDTTDDFEELRRRLDLAEGRTGQRGL